MAQDVIVEMIVGETAYPLPAVYDETAVEITVDPPIEVEVSYPIPDTHYQIGGTNPAADPTILVWYDILGAQA